MLFADVVGQAGVKAQLLGQLRSDRVPHAQLLLGPEGCGKLALALAYAQYLQCDQPGETEACGKCENCHKAGRLMHPDIHFSFPTVGGKATSSDFMEFWRSMLEESSYFGVNDWLQHLGAENKQGNITAEECVQIVKKLSLKIFEGKYKVLILWLPEYLGKEGNRLLKLIEEPSPRTVFLLLAEQSDRILNTILSRCQLLRVPPLRDEEVAAGLQHQAGLAPEQASNLARLADGNFREALALSRSEQNNYASLFLEWMRYCFRGRVSELHPWIERFAGSGRENQKQFFRYALHFLGELLHLKAGRQNALRLGSREAETAGKMAGVIPMEVLPRLAELYNDGILFIERNANPRILMMDTSMEVHELLRKK